MEDLVAKLKEIFEVKELDLTLKFTDLKEWDSLSALTVLAMLDSDFGVTLNLQTLLNFVTIKDFCDYVIKNKK